MANPAKGTQTVSRNGPSLPTKSSHNLCHPFNNMQGLFHKATALIISTSTGMAIKATSVLRGREDNLRKTPNYISKFIRII